MGKVWIGLALGLGIPLAVLAGFYLWAKAGRYPLSRYAEVVTYAAAAPPPVSEALTVVSYNIGYLSGLTNNVAVARTPQLFEQNLALAIATLQALTPDLIGLQEIDLAAKRSYDVNQVQALAEALALPTGAIAVNWDKNYVPFPYWPPSAHFGRILSGQAVLSRYPIQANQRIELARVPTKPFYYNALYLDRLAQVTQVEINGRPLILINVHLEAFDAPTRLGQTQVVRDLAIEYAREYPVILLGDFNSAVNRTGHPEEGDSPSISLLRQTDELAPTVPPAQWSDSAQLTYPSDTPQYKLDYIFYTPKTLELLSSRVVSEAAQASDHLPIAATFRFRSP